MAGDEDPEQPAPSASRPPLRKPGSDTEKALTLEVARLFGMSPRDLMHRQASRPGSEPVKSGAGEEASKTDPDAG
jgi:hypothetical protein